MEFAVTRSLLILAISLGVCASKAAADYDQSPFGINGLKLMHAYRSPDIGETAKKPARAMKDAGIHWDRLELWWHVLEPEQGKFDWEFSAARNEGVRHSATHGGVEIEYEDDGLWVKESGVRRLIRLSEALRPDISPDGERVAVAAIEDYWEDSSAWERLGEYSSLQNIYVLHRNGSGLTKLTREGGTHPVWHPDGSGLAYITPRGDLAWIGRDGSGWKILIREIKASQNLRWTADGKSLMVLQETDKGVAWYSMTPPSNELKRVTRLVPVPEQAHVIPSPSGRSVATIRLTLTDDMHRTETVHLEVKTPSARHKFDFQVGHLLGDAGGGTAWWSHKEDTLIASVGGALFLIDVSSGTSKQLTPYLY